MKILLECYDKNFVKVGNITRYDSLTFTDNMFTDSTFTLKFKTEQANLDLIFQTRYILITKEYLSEILYFKKVEDEDYTVEVKGYNIKHILRYRVCYVPMVYTKDAVTNMRSLVNQNFLTKYNKREVSILKLEENPVLDKVNFSISVHKSEVYEYINDMAKYRNIRYQLIPILIPYDENSDNPQNISSIVFKTTLPVDLTRDNTEGNSPVVFESELNNLLSSSYEYNNLKTKNYAYVEGKPYEEQTTGQSEYLVDAGDTQASGLDRIETYLSSSVKSEEEDGSKLTEDEYKKRLKQDGNQQLQKHRIKIESDGELNTVGGIFQFGRDFDVGCIVTIKDKMFGQNTNALVSGYQYTKSDSGEHIDIFLDYEYNNRELESETQALENVSTVSVNNIENNKGEEEYKWL